jgi:hypothetical protein
MRPEGSPDDDARLARTLGAMVRLVSEPGAPAAIASDRRAWLAAQGLAPEDERALAAVEPRRLLVYRRLVRTGLREAVRAEIPRTAARLGDGFDAIVDRFCDEALPRSPYLRDVAVELVAFATPLWRADPSVPAWIPELAAHELVELEVGWHEGDAGPEPTAANADALALDRPVRLDPGARVARYHHAIHRLDADLGARDEPASEPTALLGYRDRDLAVRFLELTPLAAALVERLRAGDALGAAVLAATAAVGEAPRPEVLAGAASLLADLAARGVVRGPG